jgi:PAS domain S-box-containing protein
MPSPEAELEALRRENDELREVVARDRRLLDVVLQQSPHGIIILDRKGGLVLHNEAAERIWGGFEPVETVADWVKYRAFHPDGTPYAAEDWSALAGALQGVRPVEPREHHIQRFDGEFAWVLGSSAPLLDDQGEHTGAMAVFVDITPLKQLQQDARRHALEVNDDVVQGVTAARMALALGRSEQADAAIESALAAARKIVNDLLGDAGTEGKLLAGGLRREAATGE